MPQATRIQLWLAAQAPWTGDEPPVERDVYWFDLGKDVRMWLAPRRGLQILVWAGDGAGPRYADSEYHPARPE